MWSGIVRDRFPQQIRVEKKRIMDGYGRLCFFCTCTKHGHFWVLKLPNFSGDQTMQMYGNFDKFLSNNTVDGSEILYHLGARQPFT